MSRIQITIKCFACKFLPHVLVVNLVEDFVPRQIFYLLIDRLVKHSIVGPQFENAILKARSG